MAFGIDGDGGWLLDLRNGSMHKVLTEPSIDEFAWAPNGHEVAFHSGRSAEWGMWIMRPD